MHVKDMHVAFTLITSQTGKQLEESTRKDVLVHYFILFYHRKKVIAIERIF